VIGGVGLVAAGTGLGWLSAGADYARYLPRTVRSGRIVGATVLGATLPLAVLIPMGALMATGDAGLAAANDPVAAVGSALPSWMLVPYLLTAVAGLIAAADLSMYSSGLNLLTGGIRVSRSAAVAVDAVLITAAGVYITVVAKDFYGPFTTFLTLLAVPLTAWAGIVAVDLIGRREYDTAGLLDTRPGSRYWYTAGLRVPAVLAWVVAIVAGVLCTRAQAGDDVWFAGPLSDTWIGRNGLGWLVAGVLGGALYAGLRALPARTEATIEAVRG
jgi:purine-cytosine permease-like protein